MKMANGTLMMTFDCVKAGNSVKNAVSSMNKISAKAGWTSRAVSVMSPDQVSWPSDFTSNWRNEFEVIGREALNRFLKRNHVGAAPSSKILFEPYHSKKGAVQAVLSEIESSKPSAVAVFTKTAKTNRGLPAGFVSSIIAKSGAPVFVISATAPTVKSLKTIVFATDFSKVDENAFEHALDFAAQVGAKVLIVNVLQNFANELISSYAGLAGGWDGYGEMLEQQESEANTKGRTWVERAKTRGVKASYELLSNSRTIASGILKSAKKHGASLIVMTEKTGPWEAVFLGSVTREILEKSTDAVLVIPSSQKKKSS